MRMHTVKSVLLVDDDQDYKYFFYKAMDTIDPEIKVTSANDGIEALKKLEESKPDIVILDFNMPRMNGLAFLKEMRKHPDFKNIPVAMFSNFFNLFDATETKELGAVHMFSKPSGFAETVETINKIFHLRGSLRKCA